MSAAGSEGIDPKSLKGISNQKLTKDGLSFPLGYETQSAS